MEDSLCVHLAQLLYEFVQGALDSGLVEGRALAGELDPGLASHRATQVEHLVTRVDATTVNHG